MQEEIPRMTRSDMIALSSRLSEKTSKIIRHIAAVYY